MISITVFIMNHNEKGLGRKLDRKVLIQPSTSEEGLVEATRTEQGNGAAGKFPFYSEFIYKLLLSRSYLNFFVWFPALTVFGFFLISHQQILPPPHPQKHQLILFLSSFLSLSSTFLFHVLFNLYTIMYVCMCYYSTYYIFIYYSALLLTYFNLILLCIILPAWETIDGEKCDICFSSQKGYLKPPLQYIRSSSFFFPVAYECIKNRSNIIFQFGMRSIRLQTFKIKL